MRKGVPIGCGALLLLAVIGMALPNTPKAGPTTAASESASPTSEATPTESTDINDALPTPELYVDDLGEASCSKFEVCTFVNIVANVTCKNAEIDIDLYDSNDEYIDTEAVAVGTLKKGKHRNNVEVGTDDTDAEYVEQSDYTCQ